MPGERGVGRELQSVPCQERMWVLALLVQASLWLGHGAQQASPHSKPPKGDRGSP